MAAAASMAAAAGAALIKYFADNRCVNSLSGVPALRRTEAKRLQERNHCTFLAYGDPRPRVQRGVQCGAEQSVRQPRISRLKKKQFRPLPTVFTFPAPAIPTG